MIAGAESSATMSTWQKPSHKQPPFPQKFHPFTSVWDLRGWIKLFNMYKVKVAVVGPSQAGKTMISNFLADATDNIGGGDLSNA